MDREEREDRFSRALNWDSGVGNWWEVYRGFGEGLRVEGVGLGGGLAGCT